MILSLIQSATAEAVVKGMDTFDAEVVDEFLNSLVKNIVTFTFHLLIAIVVFYLGKFIIKRIYRLVDVILTKRNVEHSLSTFILSLVKIVLYFVLIIVVIGILGIETSSFLALFASAGVAIGMALSGTLQNFAGGVLILLLKPYKVGDYIEAQGYAGTVTEIQIFNTIICTPDNKSIIIPNGGLSTGSINNWSRMDYRRVEWTISISYGDDVNKVRQAILDMFKADPAIVRTTTGDHRNQLTYQGSSKDKASEGAAEGNISFLKRSQQRVQERLQAEDMPVQTRQTMLDDSVNRAPAVYVSNMASSSVDISARAWVPTAKYWEVFYKYNERFYTELPTLADVHFPFPQMDVHIREKGEN